MVVLVLTFVSRHAAADYEAHGSNQPPTSLSPTRVTQWDSHKWDEKLQTQWVPAPNCGGSLLMQWWCSGPQPLDKNYQLHPRLYKGNILSNDSFWTSDLQDAKSSQYAGSWKSSTSQNKQSYINAVHDFSSSPKEKWEHQHQIVNNILQYLSNQKFCNTDNDVTYSVSAIQDRSVWSVVIQYRSMWWMTTAAFPSK